MKRYIYIMMAVLAGAFASCSKEDASLSPGTEGTQSVTIKLVADDAVTRASATGLSQYIIEVYSDDAYTTAENIFGEGATATHRATSVDGSFSMVLDRTKDYYCLFWADKDATAYTTATLKAVTLASGKTPAEAWFGTRQISGNQPTQTITLKRAVAKLNLLETGKLIAGTTLKATFAQPTTFDVSAGTAGSPVSRTETITLTDAVNGTEATPAQLGTGYFILSPASTQYVAKVTFRCGDEDAFDVNNVPFQANHATNIKGHYTSLAYETFTVSCDDGWITPDDERNFNPSIWNGTYPATVEEAKNTMATAITTNGGEVAANYVFTITTAQQLAAFAYLVNNGVSLTSESSDVSTFGKYSSSTYQLAADIDLDNKAWTPIGTLNNSFVSVFDGQRHIVRNMKVNISTTEGVYAGFFGYVSSQTLVIKNLIVKGTVQVVGNYSHVGGICGYIETGQIAFCRFNGDVSSTANNTVYTSGGIAGWLYKNGSITGCISDAVATGSGQSSSSSGIGGLVGRGESYGTSVKYSAWNKSRTAVGIGNNMISTTTANNGFDNIAGLNDLLDKINNGVTGNTYIWQKGAGATDYPVLVKKP